MYTGTFMLLFMALKDKFVLDSLASCALMVSKKHVECITKQLQGYLSLACLAYATSTKRNWE